MTRALLDINVVLDVLLERRPHLTASRAVWAAVESRRIEGVLAAHAYTTIFCLVRHARGLASARSTIAALLPVFGVAATNGDVLRLALTLPPADFEDSVTAAAAHLSGCDALVTRDPRSFPQSPVRVVSPEVAAALLAPRE